MTSVSQADQGLQIAIGQHKVGSQVPANELYFRQEFHSHLSPNDHGVLDQGTTTQPS